ncbi:MAG: amidohydrolase [Nitritalea sp.]
MKLLIASFFLFLLYCPPTLQAQDSRIKAYIQYEYPELEALYKHLHQNPELSLQEKETSARMAAELKRAGFQVQTGIGGYGVVGVFENGPGPTVLIRTDMDALPMEEKTGLPFASKKKGVTADGQETYIAHSCGHDIHMTVFVGTARTLVEFKNRWKGTLVMVAQPAEENGMGAYQMFQDSLYQKIPYPDFALALHDDPFLPAGTLGFKEGALMAGVDMMNITVYGEGGHGAAPHTTIDPIVLSAQLIQSFQTIVSRKLAPTTPAVITVGAIRGGSVHNIIPDQVELLLTIRTYSPEVREEVLTQIKHMSQHLARAAGMGEDKLPTFKLREPHTPALINDGALTARLRGVMEENFGMAQVVDVDAQMIGEDFSRFGLQEKPVPLSMFYLGAGNPEFLARAKTEGLEIPGLHSPYFAPDYKPTLLTGVEAMTLAALSLLQEETVLDSKK